MLIKVITTRAAYLRYKEEAEFQSEGTKKQYRPKIDKFSANHSDTNVDEAISAEIFELFISEDKTEITLAALEHFYHFVNIHLLKKDHFPPFPLNKLLLKQNFRKQNTEGETDSNKKLYLPHDFDFTELFNDKWYEHLKDRQIIIALKACIAVCLGAAFDTSEIESLTIGDIAVNNNLVKVKNPYQNFNTPWISYNEELSEIINQFYKIRLSQEHETDLFFVNTWSSKDTRDIEPDKEIWKLKKPTYIKGWVSYILNFISHQLKLETRLTLVRLKDNAIYQYLLRTNGSGIDRLIRTYGWSSFVIKAVTKYYEEETTISAMTMNLDIIPSQDIDDSEYNFFFSFRSGNRQHNF